MSNHESNSSLPISYEKSLSREELRLEFNKTWYPEKPIVVGVKEAETSLFQNKPLVEYEDDGTAIFRHPHLEAAIGKEEIEISPDAIFDTTFASFASLNTALSAASNSPRFGEEKTLREQFDEEFETYMGLASEALANGAEYVPYGSYVFDPVGKSLTQILPEKWMRLGLLTSNSKLITDPEGQMGWEEIQTVLSQKVVGYAGVSVGGGVLEASLRNGRFHHTKMADPDTLSIQNLNRAERANISHLSLPKSARFDRKNLFDMQLWNKARYMANEQHMVDPYQTLYVYDEGISEDNVHTFLNGGENEPRIDLLVEEVDDPRWKYQLRKLAREYRIPVLMMSDFGHRVQMQFQDFANNPELELGYNVSDAHLDDLYVRMMNSGNIEDRWNFIDAFCGPEYRTDEADELAKWVRKEGEQPTASLPQLGSTAMVSGGIGGEVIAKHFLGHQIPERQIWDLKKGTVSF